MAVKTHRYDGTSLTKGQADRSRDRGVIVAIVDGLDNNINALDAAIDAAVDELGDSHPDDDTLLLIDSTAKWWNPTTAMVSLFYARIPSTPSVFSASSMAIEEVAFETRSGTTTAEMWPGGPVVRSKVSRPYPLIRITVPTILESRPSYESIVGRINDSGLYLLDAEGSADTNRTIDPCTLRFDGAAIRPFEHRDGVRYSVQYRFLYRDIGWYSRWMVYYMRFPDDPEPEPPRIPIYPTASFVGNGAFPTHDGNGIFASGGSANNCEYDAELPED